MPHPGHQPRRLPAWVGHPLVLQACIASLVYAWWTIPTFGPRISTIGRALNQVGVARPHNLSSQPTPTITTAATYLREADGTLTSIHHEDQSWDTLGKLFQERPCDVYAITLNQQERSAGFLFPTTVNRTLVYSVTVGWYQASCLPDPQTHDRVIEAFTRDLASPQRLNRPELAQRLTPGNLVTTSRLASGYAMNTLTLLALAGVIASPFALPTWFRAARGKRRAKAGLCPRCGYDLRTDSAARCPECGHDPASKYQGEPVHA